MVSWCLVLLSAVAVFGAETSKKPRQTKSADSAAAGTDFFPHFNNFPSFPAHSPAVLPPPPPHDLTALQQTHVLGDFQHRFQQQRFPTFQNQPLLFNQQTEFGQPPQQNTFNNQQRLPPQHVVPPQQVTFPQQNQFRQAPPKPAFQQPFQQEPRPSFVDQRNQFPERQAEPTFGNQQFQEQPFRQNNFRPTSNPTFQQNQPPPSVPLQQFQDQSVRPPFFEENRNNQFNGNRNQQFFEQEQRNPPFRSQETNQFNQRFPQENFQNNPPPQSPSKTNFQQLNDFQSNSPPPKANFQSSNDFQSNQVPPKTNFQPLNDFQSNAAPPKGNFQPQNDFQSNAAPPKLNFPQSNDFQNNPQGPPKTNFQQLNDFQSNSAPPKPNFQPSNDFQNNQAPPKTNFQQPNFQNNPAPPKANFPQSNDFQSNSAPPKNLDFQPRPSFQHPIQNYQFTPNKPEDPPVSFNPNRKPAFLPTQLPKTSEETYNEPKTYQPKRPLLPLIPTDFPEPTTESSEPKDFYLQKSQEQTYFPKNVEYQPNAISPAPPPRTPKPEVKEITINLAPTPAPDKKEKSPRTEKTQEELINEQIQKLLQGHNLELAGSGPKSDLPPVPELPAHLKDKYQIKLVNSEVLNELKSGKKKKPVPPPSPPSPPPLPDLPDHIKKQYDVKLVQKDELFKQFKIGTGGKLVTNSDLVSGSSGNESTVFLANGQQLEIVHLPKGDVTTTSKPPRELFEELKAGGEIPAGANYELIKHNANGEIEKVNDLTSAKKVTFVLLEEQPDGTVKVQGVKGNSNPEKTDNESVESLIKKINDGSLKLPPSQSILTNEIPHQASTHKSYVTASPKLEYVTELTTSQEIFTTATELPETTFTPEGSSKRPKSKSRPHFLPTPGYNFESTTYPSRRHKSSKRPSRRKPTTTTTTAQYEYDDEDYNQRSSNYNGEGPLPQDVVGQESSLQPSPSLTKILQNYGLFEMAKFLDQSGLDTILNETGPYTIFIPTDEAFANLQEQLGGTDKAEDKFRENPRLLSGLLLHHVVPGSFKLTDLQDEMTGVSLAGTQLRVNTYNSEKKDSVITINGAVVSPSKRDIPVPQGIAHAVDRVLFPLPVGDLVQTLKGDRERRFGKFVKSIEASGLVDMLTGTKTYTVFAPTDKAFAALTDEELDKLLARREAARTIVLRHVMPGTLYSAGMHFFQVKESMERGQKITIKKELGKVKANSAQVVNANIPSTNGVIHVLDTLL